MGYNFCRNGINGNNCILVIHMEFLNQKLYHNQIIKEQYKNREELYIITLNDSNKYVLWQNNKQIATSKDVTELHKKIKNY